MTVMDTTSFSIQTLCYSGFGHDQEPEHQSVLNLTAALSCIASCGSPWFVPLDMVTEVQTTAVCANS